MKQYWTMIGGKMSGPHEIPELVSTPGFKTNVPVFLSGQEEWKEAVHFPAIVRYLKTGELPEDTVVGATETTKIKPENWREAIVAANVQYPDRKIAAPEPIYVRPHANQVVGMSKLHLKLSQVAHPKKINQQWQKVLLLILGVGLYGTYQPAVQFLPELIDGAGSDVMVISAPVRHAHSPWRKIKHLFPSHSEVSIATVTQKSTAPQIVEVESSALGDGMTTKMVTTMTEVNGTKVYKTKTYVQATIKKHR